MLSSEHVGLCGHLTFQEALRCYYLHDRWCGLWSNWNVFISLGVVLLVLLPARIIFPAAIADRFVLPPGASSLVLAFVLGLVGVLLPCLVVHQRRKGPDLSEDTHYTFDAIGYEVAQRVWRYRVDWPSVREIRESKSMFFLYLLPTQATVIPKRYFLDGRTLDAWRSLIAANAPSVSIRRDSIAGRFL